MNLFMILVTILFLIFIYQLFGIETNYNNFYEGIENQEIPKNVFMTWHTKDIPYYMEKNLNKLIKDNPDFKFYLYDDNDNINFLDKYFVSEVVEAYKGLTPNSYKSDLFRFAVLYIYGGIYLDVKINTTNNFKLNELIYSEHYIEDNVYDGYPGIYTAVMVIKKGNPLMMDIINKIVINVKNKDYSQRVLGITGPKLYYDKYHEKKELYNLSDIDMKHYYDDTGAVIEWKGKKIFSHYPEYRDEQKNTQQTEHYTKMFEQRCVFNECN